jgi:GMP synthase-like glutamine amidotransferase
MQLIKIFFKLHLEMILIIQNGNVDTHIGKYLDEEYEIIKSFKMNIDELDLQKYSMIFILGGNDSIKDINYMPHLQRAVKLIKQCIQIEKPLIGICLGCQLLAYSLGYTIKFGNKLYMDHSINIFGYNNIFRCHYDYIDTETINDSKISSDIICDDDGNCIPYSIKYRNLVGLQCHPDIPPEYIHEYHSGYVYDINLDTELINENNKKVIRCAINMTKDH